MLRRKIAFAALALVFVAAGCGDQASRTGPRDSLASLNLTPDQNSYWVEWVKLFSDENKPLLRGTSTSLTAQLHDATDKSAIFLQLVQFLTDPTNYAELATPARAGAPATLEAQLALFLSELAQRYGIIQQGGLDLEHLVTIVTANDFPNATDDKCFPTTKGNAAMCLKLNSLNLPAFVSVVEQGTRTIVLPPGYIPSGKIFQYDAYGSINSGGDGVVVLLCAPNVSGRTFAAFRAEKGASNFLVPNPNDYQQINLDACHDWPQVAMFEGDGLLARTGNTVATFLRSAMTPKAAYATHSLAHRGTAFSDWIVGEQRDVYRIQIVGVNSGTIDQGANTFAVSRNTGNITFYVEVYKDNVKQMCAANLTVKATPTFAGFDPGTEVQASSCSFHGATNTERYQFTFTNTRQGNSATGTISFTVNNKPASNMIGFSTN